MPKQSLLDGAIIPLDDPAAALQFCRALRETIDGPVKQKGETELSVVVPMFNEEENISILISRLTTVLDSIGLKWEIVFVDDGSKDRTAEMLLAHSRERPGMVIVELARNFGHQLAITAGLHYAAGDIVAIIDADLQDPPEALPQMVAKCREGWDVVYGIRRSRKEPGIKRFCYASFYRILHFISQIDIPLDAGDFCVMNRRIVDLLNRMPERGRFIRGIRSWVGFKQLGVEVDRDARFAGTPKYTLRSLVHLAFDGLVSFSFFPLRMISMLGGVISVFSICLSLFFAVKKMIYGLNPPGFATIVVLICFFSGINLIMLGVIGEYVGHIFREVKQRPAFVVRNVHGLGGDAHSDA